MLTCYFLRFVDWPLTKPNIKVGDEKYYGDNTNELVKLAEGMDMKFISNLAIYARKEMHLRSVSHALVAIVARYGAEYTKETVFGVVERADDITEILAW